MLALALFYFWYGNSSLGPHQWLILASSIQPDVRQSLNCMVEGRRFITITAHKRRILGFGPRCAPLGIWTTRKHRPCNPQITHERGGPIKIDSIALGWLDLGKHAKHSIEFSKYAKAKVPTMQRDADNQFFLPSSTPDDATNASWPSASHAWPGEAMSTTPSEWHTTLLPLVRQCLRIAIAQQQDHDDYQVQACVCDAFGWHDTEKSEHTTYLRLRLDVAKLLSQNLGQSY